MAKNVTVKRKKVNSLSSLTDRGVKRALTKIGGTILARADQYAPIDTKALINSGFHKVEETSTGYMLRVGYMQEYALWLHEAPMGSWHAAPVGTKVYDQGKGQPPRIKTASNPNATPNWLGRGLEEAEPIINRMIIDEIKNDAK